MKAASIFLIVISFIGYGYAQQNIFPLTADTPRWCMVTSYYEGSSSALFNYSPFDVSCEKDTLVDGRIYSKLIRNRNPLKLFALVRNENKKVFIRHAIYNSSQTQLLSIMPETPLYDFTMSSVNDSIQILQAARFTGSPDAQLWSVQRNPRPHNFGII